MTNYSAPQSATQQVFSSPSIGHNSPPFDFFEFFDRVVDSSATTYEKLIALILARHAGRDGKAAFPSRARVMKQASCSMATFKRSQAALAAFFEAEERTGKSTMYTPKPLVTADEIEIALTDFRAQAKAQKDTGRSQSRALTDTTRGLSQIPGGALTDTGVGISQIPQKDSLNYVLKKDSDPNGSGAEAPETSLRELVWTKCISWLLPRSCLDEARLRIRVGRWVQEFGAAAVIDAVAIAQKEAPVSIMAYVEGILHRKARPKQVKSYAEKRRDFIAELDRLEGVTDE